MAIQARAEATRRRILESAADLFSESGYGETGLADVLQRAKVSKGAFYYHFDSKEALAREIIDEFDQRAAQAVEDNFDPEAPTLEGIIRATFEVQDLMRNDRMTGIGQLLSQALGQICPSGARVYKTWTERFVAMVTMVISTGELRGDLDAEEVAEAIWVAVLGCHLVSAAVNDDCFARLGRSWRVLLRSALPDGEMAHAEKMLGRVVADYQAAVPA